jgi:hypothetical protein
LKLHKALLDKSPDEERESLRVISRKKVKFVDDAIGEPSNMPTLTMQVAEKSTPSEI